MARAAHRQNLPCGLVNRKFEGILSTPCSRRNKGRGRTRPRSESKSDVLHRPSSLAAVKRAVREYRLSHRRKTVTEAVSQCDASVASSLYVALLAANNHLKINSAQLKWFHKTTRVYVRLSTAVSMSHAMSWLKRLAAEVRLFALTSGRKWLGTGQMRPPPLGDCRHRDGKRAFFQFSRFARALSCPWESVVTKSLEDHANILQERFESRSSDLVSIARFGTWVAKDSQAAYGSPSLSASFSVNVRKGGICEDVRRLTNELRAKEVDFDELKQLSRMIPPDILGGACIVTTSSREAFLARGRGRADMGLLRRLRLEDVAFHYDRSFEISIDDWELRREILFAVVACWLDCSGTSPPRCRQVAIKERGWKVRTVTPVSGSLAFLSKVLNGLLLQTLKKYPQLSWSLREPCGDRVEIGNVRWTAGRRLRVRSADLKSASDLLPHDLMHTLAISWARAVGLGRGLTYILERCVGPFNMTCRDGRVVKTSRGLLMGVAVTWPLLSLYMLWLHVRVTGVVRGPLIVGDDYVAVLTRKQDERFTRVLERTGGKPSVGKDYSVSGRYGVFCEHLIDMAKGRIYFTTSLRLLCAEHAGSHGKQPLWTLGNTLTVSLLRDSRLRAGAGFDLVRYTFDGQLNDLRRLGVDPFAPRWMLGAGFPGIPCQRSLQLSRGLASQSHKFITEILSDWGSSFSGVGGSSDLSLREEFRALVRENFVDVRTMESLVAQGELRSETAPDRPMDERPFRPLKWYEIALLEFSDSEWKPLERHETIFVGARQIAYAIALGGSALPSLPKIRILARNYRGIIARMERVCWWMNPRERVRSVTGLYLKAFTDRPFAKVREELPFQGNVRVSVTARGGKLLKV